MVDSWGKMPSGILQGNIFSVGAFSECLNIQRDNEKYESQYCLASLTAKAALLDALKPKPQARIAMPMYLSFKFCHGTMPAISPRATFVTFIIVDFRPGANEITFSWGTCFPQSCSPEEMQKRILLAIPKDYRDKVSVTISESACQTEERPLDLRLIDWITM